MAAIRGFSRTDWANEIEPVWMSHDWWRLMTSVPFVALGLCSAINFTVTTNAETVKKIFTNREHPPSFQRYFQQVGFKKFACQSRISKLTIPSRMLLRVPMKYQLKPNQYTSAYNREMVVKLWPRYKESKNAMTRRNLWKLSKRFVETLMIMASVKHFNATFLREIGVLQMRSIHWQSDLIMTSILLLSTTRISTRNQRMTLLK